MEKNPIIQDDILRYKKNKLASLLAILGLVFSALYFMIVYALNNDSFYTIFSGFSVIVTLLVLLIAFYSSESVKNYKKKFAIVLLVLAAIEVIRIFYYPLKVFNWDGSLLADKASNNDPESYKYVVHYFTVGLTPTACGLIMVIYLIASAACFVGSAFFGYFTAVRLEKHVKAVESGEIDIDAVLGETDAFAMSSNSSSTMTVDKEVE